ncbi:MAG: ABC transporter substrate-binding protein [Hyphomicrobiaceae bacterium]
MDRRTFLFVFFLGALSAPLAAEAQQAEKVYRVGLLALLPGEHATRQMNAFKARLRDLGYIEGKNLVFEFRSAEGRPERLATLAAELLQLGPDVIIAGGGTLTAQTVKQATRIVPVVMAGVGDAIASGLVATLARPGGNVTGLSALGPDIAGKRLEFLRDGMPTVNQVAVLANPMTPFVAQALKVVGDAARALRIQIHVVEMTAPDQLDRAFEAVLSAKPGALLVLEDPLTFALRTQIAGLAAQHRLPSVFGSRDYVEVGGLMSYGTDLADLSSRAAIYVDKILKGANPADMPVEQPTKFELVINLKTARALGLTIPTSLLARADEVIE